MYQSRSLAVYALVSTIDGSLFTKNVEVLLFFWGCIAGSVISKLVHKAFAITTENNYVGGCRLSLRERGNLRAEKMIKPEETKRVGGNGGKLLERPYSRKQSERNLRTEKMIEPQEANKMGGSGGRLCERLQSSKQTSEA